MSAALLLVVPPRVRPWAAVLGAGYTTATGVSTLIGQWHRPSDVVAGVLVVLAWTAIACALVALTPARVPTTTGALRLPARADADGDPTPATMRLVVSGLLVVVGRGRRGCARRSPCRTPGSHRETCRHAPNRSPRTWGSRGGLMASCLAFAIMLVLRQAAASQSSVPGTSG